MWQKLRGCACEKPKTPNGELYILRLQRNLHPSGADGSKWVDAQKDRAVLGVLTDRTGKTAFCSVSLQGDKRGD